MREEYEEMDIIKLNEIFNIENLENYKIHFAKWNGDTHPLDAYMRDFEEWRDWNRYSSSKNDFNRQYIFSMIDFYPERDTWLFGGIWEIKGRYFGDGNNYPYEIELCENYQKFIGRLKITYSYKERTVRVKMEKHFDDMVMKEILVEPYSCVTFPGYRNVDFPFLTIKNVTNTDNIIWKSALSVKGIYLISDIKTGKRYVGSASGTEGIWGRWRDYIADGHGGNDDLKKLVNKKGFDYVRANFKFTILEISNGWDDIIERESYWKRVLLTRQEEFGHNKN